MAKKDAEDTRIAKVESELEALSCTPEDLGDLVDTVRAMSVVSSDDREFAAEILGDTSDQIKELISKRKWLTEPLNEALDRSRSIFREPIKILEEVKGILKTKIAQSLEDEEAAQALAMEEAAETGDLSNISDTVTSVPKNTQVRHVWTYEVEDEEKIPRDFLMPNDSLLEATVKEFEGDTNIPGIRVFCKTKVQMSGQRKKGKR